MQIAIFAGIALVAILVVYLILRVVVSFVSAIPKWLYVLIFIGVIAAVAFAVFETAVVDSFATYK
jgi:hypothetical protein